MKFAAVASVFLASAIAAPLEERSDNTPGYGSPFQGGNPFQAGNGRDYDDYNVGYSRPAGFPGRGVNNYAGYRRNDDGKFGGDYGHFDNKGYGYGGFPSRNGFPSGGYPYNRGNPRGAFGNNWNNGNNWNRHNGGNWNGGNWNNGNGNNGNNGNGNNGNNGNGNNGNNGNNGGSKGPLCPTGLLYSVPKCCQTDVLGIANLDCQTPTGSPDFSSDFKKTCRDQGRKAQCCAILVAGLAVLCTEAI